MSADQPQQQFAGHNTSMQAVALVPAVITLALSLLLYATRIRARRYSPFVWADGMITAALVSNYRVLLALDPLYPDSFRYWQYPISFSSP